MMLAHNNYTSRNHRPYGYYNQQNLNLDFDSSNPPLPGTLDNLPAAAAAVAASQRYRFPTTQAHPQSHHHRHSQSLTQVPELMPSDSWMLRSQQTPRAANRFSHHRESSLSSLGSNGPTSPYNSNTTNPQIAITDSAHDAFHDDPNYSYNHMMKPISMAENIYATALANLDGSSGMNGQGMTAADMSMGDGLPQQQQQKRGGLAPAPELSIGGGSSTRSRPVSVASSIVGGDSPATPSFHEPEEDGKRNTKNGETSALPLHIFLGRDYDYEDCSQFFDETVFPTPNNNIPKLDRTMTDIYNDELYNPNFTITSASPPPQTHLAMSPSNDLFAKTLQAANSQHLSAVQSPVSNGSRDRSPFRQGSPYASALDDFPKVGMNQMRLGSAQQIREKRKAEQDAKELENQMARNSKDDQGTPSTISPKDAVLEFNEADDSSNFPLFPAQENGNAYGLEPANNTNTHKAISQHSSPPFQSMASTPIQSGFNFSMPTNMQMPQQYPFISRGQQQPSTPSMSTFSRVSSSEASGCDTSNDRPIQKPARTNADGGTYTCTYHGCTLRFETPALLQKHKREGHRQANALHHIRGAASSAAMPGNILNSQAGPHRCDRINPSTGKPCNTVFSRPYDLTRHEDTIHNARKQKVRCDLCTEEKTFSRADALTRHYRVCHPDVEFPGKHRRRGGATAGV
ncbi:hypothetical protein F4810DRAFT_667775 [Camillea tinctor]|nr:hypothetical protein F4810DRAFT_667775 [Camillea tinctor]